MSISIAQSAVEPVKNYIHMAGSFMGLETSFDTDMD